MFVFYICGFVKLSGGCCYVLVYTHLLLLTVDLFISYFHVAKMKTDISDWNNNGVKLIKLKSDRLEVHLLSLGATIHSVIYPGAEEDLGSRDVVLGFDTEAGYDGTDNPFFWGTTGRFTNR